jgi:hypothetical protein
MTALPKTDTNYTALSLMPTITGNTFAASLRTDICPQRKESSSTSHALNPFNLNFFDFVSDGPEVALNWLFPDLNFFDSVSVSDGPEVALNWPFPYPI